MKKLLAYINSLSTQDQVQFGEDCNTSIGYLRKACSISQLLNPKICVSIERLTKGAIKRTHLRPNDFKEIWPELKG